MHHTRSKSPVPCSCRSTNDAPAAMVSLTGPAILVQPASLRSATVDSELSAEPGIDPFGSPIVPEPPPPRA